MGLDIHTIETAYVECFIRSFVYFVWFVLGD